MRYFIILGFLIGFISCNFSSNLPAKNNNITFANNKVVAHRGAWKDKDLPQNSIASLKHAIALNCTGSEFDVRMTADDVLIVTHDADYHELEIEASTYDELAKYKLPNGEKLPTLKEYIIAGMTDNSSTGLVCEIKPSKKEGRNLKITNQTMALVKELNAESYISYYISFSYKILKRIREINPLAKTLYLDGSKKPEVLKVDGITGLDYHFSKFQKRPDWIKKSKDYGLILNAWTANETKDIDWLLANDFDLITTDNPELVFERIKKSPIAQDWKLVWSDEFNYSGKPDSTKWKYNYGFLSNREEQYYTDNLKNVRVENGILTIETHKEKIANAKYKSDEFKNKSWLKYIAEIDTAKYTSAKLTTAGLASWKYARIDVKAKLPKGVGLWPAIWMLGDNRKEVGWPKCGEIDIMEHVGFNPDSIFGTIHTEAYNHMKKTEKGKHIYIEKPYDDYHVFTLEWTPEKMDFILDGVVYNHIKNEQKTEAEWPFDQKFYLILNVAVGGMLGGQKGIAEDIFPNQMMIDYVRVYQKEK